VIRVPAVCAAFAAVLASAMAASRPLTVPGHATPVAVAALGSLEGALAFAVSEDGAVALATLPSEHAARRSVLRIGHADGTAGELELPGEAPALVVAAAGDVAFAIVRESDKKGAIRRVTLVRVDPATVRATTQLALPATARGLAFGAGEASLLVASKDDLRSFMLPALTSGPLFRVAGANTAVAPLAGSTRVLLAQGARLVVVDLASPQNREGLPVAAAIEAAAPVRMLASSPDEATGLAQLEDGSVVGVETEPLHLVPRQPAAAIAWPGVPAEPAAPTAVAQTVVPVVAPMVAHAADIAAEPTPAAPPPAAAPPDPTEAPPAQLVPAQPGTVSGTITGPARAFARQVVVFGPDNILKEAARVAPDGAGRYTVRGLRIGSYRIVAAGENGGVLVCTPPYVTVKVSSGAALEAEALDVLRAY
jgi:hypothetical protein